MEKLLNFIFLPRCTLCGKESGNVLCKKCLEECKLIFSANCIVCDQGTVNGRAHLHCAMLKKHTPISTIGLFEYHAYVRECIRNAKYSKHQFMALRVLLRYGLQQAMQNGLSYSTDLLVVPVPLSHKKAKLRGFNQAELIAKEISKSFALPIANDLLMRSKETQQQHAKTREERFENLKDAFTINKKYRNFIKGKKVLLVDDIWTTGATLLEASKVLYEGGTGEVHCFTLSKKEKMLKSKYDKFNLSTPKNRPTQAVAKEL